MKPLRGPSYHSQKADLSQFTDSDKCSIAAYILNNEDYRKISSEEFFRVCFCNLHDPNANVFMKKSLRLVDPFGFFTIKGFKVLITVSKSIESDFIYQQKKI